MNQNEENTQPLLIRPVPPTAERIDKKKFLAVFAVLGLVLVLVFGVKLQKKFAATQGVQPAPPPSRHDVQGAGALDHVLTAPTSYAGLDRRPKVPAALPAPDLPPQVMAAAPPITPPAPQAPPAQTMPPPQPAPPPAPAPAPAPPQPPKRWLFADVQNTVAKPPFPVPGRGSEEGGSLRDDTPAGEGLIRPARREKPLDPTRVLYRSQVITGMLLHAVSSDIPGQVRIMVTQPVTDKLHRGQVLIPQGSIVLGVQERTPAYGQNRLAVRIDEVHAPDGEVLALPGQLADRSGATGAKGKVNHHFARIGVAAVVSAALSIGARGIAGNPTGFQPSIGQEIARETGQSISRSGQSIVERTLDIPPTITLKAGTPVTIQLSENLSLQQPAAITP